MKQPTHLETPPVLSKEECAALFERIQAVAKSSGVSDVEAIIGAHREALTRFANNTIHQNVAEQMQWLSVRVQLDQKTARATTNRFDADSIRAAVEQSIALAKAAAPNPDLLPLAKPSTIPETPRFDAAPPNADPTARAKAVARAIRCGEGAGPTAAGR